MGRGQIPRSPGLSTRLGTVSSQGLTQPGGVARGLGRVPRSPDIPLLSPTRAPPALSKLLRLTAHGEPASSPTPQPVAFTLWGGLLGLQGAFKTWGLRILGSLTTLLS